MTDTAIIPTTLIKRTASSKKFAAEIEQLLASTTRALNKTSDSRLKLILHVGTPKTGTTSVQVYLDKKTTKASFKRDSLSQSFL